MKTNRNDDPISALNNCIVRIVLKHAVPVKPPVKQQPESMMANSL
jgi:hypothetical protein